MQQIHPKILKQPPQLHGATTQEHSLILGFWKPSINECCTPSSEPYRVYLTQEQNQHQ
jgi:hypothetical protein